MQTAIPFRTAFKYWVKLGFINFGGPAGQIAIMHRDLVERKQWISEERFLHALNYCMLLPGPEAQQLAIYIGWLLHRARGGIIAGAFFVIPSIFILLILSYLYAAYGSIPLVAGIMFGFKPVVVAIVVDAIFRVGRRALKSTIHYLIAALAFVSIYFLQIPFPFIVLSAGIIGFVAFRFHNSSAKLKDLPDEAVEHVNHSKLRNIKVLAIATGLWLLPYILLLALSGSQSLHVQEYHFFTKAAFITFGGAYAVLAYVTQTAVGEYGWLTQHQAVDGLALAETTPGPLIMVLQFVGFMAGWNHPGSMSPLTSALIGALVTTYTTFLPSFFFIFLGAPYLERLRGNKSLSAALTGITSAVVGVILNLALVFGIAVIFPNGIAAQPDWIAIFMAIAALVVLLKWKIDVLWVILAGGLAGLLVRVITK